MLKRIVLSLVLVVAVCQIVSAQVGTWEVAINSTGGVKETGVGYFSVNGNGTVTGYVLTTLTFGVGTFQGTWTTVGGTLTATLVETLHSNQVDAVLIGRAFNGILKGTVTGNGVTYSIKGKGAEPIPQVLGTWNGIVTQSGVKAPETFTGTANPDFENIIDFSGTISSPEGLLPATGQISVDPTGKAVGYSITAGTVLANFTGKYSAKTGTLTVKGIDENGVKLTGRFNQ